MRITRLFVLLVLAALLAPRTEASRTSEWRSNPPASLVSAEMVQALASLAPAVRLDQGAAADAETAEPQLFNLGDVVLVDTAVADAEHFAIGPLTLVDLNLLRGPPPSYPETRVGGFELLPPFRVGASPSLSLWSRRACGFSCREVASDSRYDPWGLITSIRAETGLPSDQFGTVDIESGNVVLDATVLGVFNTVASGANRIANYGANALAGLGWAQSKAEDVAVEQLGMSRADVEFVNVYLAVNPETVGTVARGVGEVGRKGGELLQKAGSFLDEHVVVDLGAASGGPLPFGGVTLRRRAAPPSPAGPVVTREARLRELATDPNLSSADRGWIGNQVKQAERPNAPIPSVKNPPGTDLRHPPGRANAQGFDYSEAELQTRELHRRQHRYLVERKTGTGIRIPRTPGKPGPNIPK